jgi:hypothetical protein
VENALSILPCRCGVVSLWRCITVALCLQITVPPGTGSRVPLQILVGGQLSDPLFLDYNKPSIYSVTFARGAEAPTGTESGNTSTLVVRGAGFGAACSLCLPASGGPPALPMCPTVPSTVQPMNCSLLACATGASMLPVSACCTGCVPCVTCLCAVDVLQFLPCSEQTILKLPRFHARTCLHATI